MRASNDHACPADREPRIAMATDASGIGSLSGSLAAVLLRAADDGFWIDAVAMAGGTRLSFGPFEETDVVAIWRSLARASGLPLAFVGPDGALGYPFPQLGPLLLGPVTGRRRLAVLNGRRPRFLVRRKPARLPGRPLVYREREIAAGRG